MEIAFLIAIFLLVLLQGWSWQTHRKTLESLTRRYDARERELLDRLMFVTNKPWNLPERPPEMEVPEGQEQIPDLRWREY